MMDNDDFMIAKEIFMRHGFTEEQGGWLTKILAGFLEHGVLAIKVSAVWLLLLTGAVFVLFIRVFYG